MRLVFLGTPDFAVNSLNAIINSRHEVIAVVTQPDKPVGRKAILTASPVKECALSHGIKVLQYDKISKEGIEDLKALAPDIMVTCAFGQILSQEVLDIAPKGVINVHGSLLPKYRGASPIQAAILNGETVSGVTIMQTERGVDSGDILLQEQTPIGEYETAGELFDKLSVIGAKLIVCALDGIENGTITPQKQDESLSTVVKMIKKQDALLDFSKPCEVLKNYVRAMYPWPVAFTYLNGKILKIYSCRIDNGNYRGETGEIVKADLNGIVVKCGEGALMLTELQAEGERRLSFRDFIIGRKIKLGDKLGT